MDQLRPVTAQICAKWSRPKTRLDPAAIAGLASRHEVDPTELATAVELASRYLDLKLSREARGVLKIAVRGYDARTVARSEDVAKSRLLGQA